ncbi:MAG TPA: hypothetical protein VF169_24920 [Albitalea sp.]|uniref:hypothetical protein n=1 Tax=Piscinibacter sp. TaxID=1903157 RepID=UPI002ED02BF9
MPGAVAALPIVVYDERALKPHVGYVFNANWLDPHESIVSMLWKFASMNVMPGHALVARLVGEDIDPYAGIEPRAVDVQRVPRLLEVASETVRLGLCAPPPGVCRHLRFAGAALDAAITARFTSSSMTFDAPPIGAGSRRRVLGVGEGPTTGWTRSCWTRPSAAGTATGLHTRRRGSA